MKIIDAIRNNISLTYQEIYSDRELAENIQQVLIWHNLLKGNADGWFGRLSTFALVRFQRLYKLELNNCTKKTWTALFQIAPNRTKAILDSTKDNFGERLLKTMKEKSFIVFPDSNRLNIIYLEGINNDFSLNCDTPNKYNDLAVVFVVERGEVKVLGKWLATNAPGRFYTDNPMNRKGALIHRNRQDTAWQFGYHSGHEALIQVGRIEVNRDRDRDFRIEEDKTDSGWFGANCHGGWSKNINDIQRDSAGCKVIYSLVNQAQFMNLAKSDRAFRRNKKHLFTVGSLEGIKLLG